MVEISQRKWVLERLKTSGLSRNNACDGVHGRRVYRLSSIIHRLRGEGYKILGKEVGSDFMYALEGEK